MLADLLALLIRELNQYIARIDGGAVGTPSGAIFGNIAWLDRTEFSTELENRLVVTLVNLQEEASLKNGKTFTNTPDGRINYVNVPVHMNLFILFSANYRNYETALRRLSHVITFFQGKHEFTPQNSPQPARGNGAVEDFKLTLDLISLSLEEVNHLWGSLGGKQLPFVVYRGRLAALMDQRILDGGGIIREIEIASRDSTS